MYRIGQKFKLYQIYIIHTIDEEYMLVQVDNFKVAMISLYSANRWNNPVEVDDVTEITEQEFKKIANCDHEIERFVKIAEPAFATI